jgi:hypothetical protein
MGKKQSQQKAATLDANTLSTTFAWFEEARPAPTSKQFHTQTGVHFEEVAEMVEEIRPLTAQATVLLHEAKVSLKALATYLKQTDNTITVEPECRTNFLDAICDQIVTATGVAAHCGFPVVEALDEVNASNWSKFVDGKAIVDANGKIMKGPGYFKPDLSAFVPSRITVLND